MLRALLAIGFRIYFTLFFKLRIYGKERYPEGPGLIASNHASFFDPPLIGAALFPKKVYFLARDTLFDSAILRWALTRCLTIPVKRGQENASVFRLVIKLVGEGKKVALFPEGTRSQDGELQEAKEGIGMMVKRANARVIPVYVHGTHQAWGIGKKSPALFGKVALVIGKPLDFSTLSGEKKELYQAITKQIMDKIKELKQWYESGAVGEIP